MPKDFSKFLQSFFEEVAEHLSVMETGLLTLEKHPDNLEILNKIFRSVHTIKGAGPIFGFDTMTGFAHAVETVLDPLRQKKLAVSRPIIDLLLESCDCLKMLAEAAKNGTVVDENRTVLDLVARLESRLFDSTLSLNPAPVPDVPPAGMHKTYRINWTPDGDLFVRALNPLKLLEELSQVGTVTSRVLDLSRLPELSELDPERCWLAWTLTIETDQPIEEIEAIFDLTAPPGGLTITALPSSASDASQTKSGTAAGNAESAVLALRVNEDKNASGGLSGPASEGDTGDDEDDPRMAEVFFGEKEPPRLGDILIEQKLVTPDQLAEALDRQKALSASFKVPKAEASMRVDTEKIDKLINLVGELVITQSMLNDLGGRFHANQLSVLQERLAQLERNTREIHERVMSIRMLPISAIFSRFPRLVRDLALKMGKNIQLVLSGEETEIDKTVIEALGDPLTHLIRNSADHGLELPQERLDNNKPELGTIRLNAFHEGGNICITIEDDGRGLNRDKILAKAVKQGLIEENEELTDVQIWSLIFEPGFSTAEKITDISGRGVGMDVVKRNIEAVGGTISIKTAKGKGTTFALKLPLTLAIIDGMTVRVNKEMYIVPLLSIMESIQPKREAVTTIVGKGELVNVRGSYLPMIRLYEIFGLQPQHIDPVKGILLIMETEGERVAVMVDEILGQQQIVIKSIEQNFRKVDGITGAAILGDGTVGFILDVRGLLEIARRDVSVEAVAV